jgi:hypothetical protein
MSWVSELLSLSDSNNTDSQKESEERFPSHTYGPAYPIIIRQHEIETLNRLLRYEERARDSIDQSPFIDRDEINEIVEATVGDFSAEIPSPEERRRELGEVYQHWENQLTAPEDTVWATTRVEFRLNSYIQRCEARTESEHDEFADPKGLDTARTVLDRIQAARNTDSKLAVMHKQHLPLEEPGENTSE